MSSISSFNIDLVHEFCLAASEAGLTPEDLSKLRDIDILKDMREVAQGNFTFTLAPGVIDCSLDPQVPENMEVLDHSRQGYVRWRSGCYSLYVDPRLTAGNEWVIAQRVRDTLKRERMANANILDFLLENQEFIPSWWTDDRIHFFGTTYKLADGKIACRYMARENGKWVSHARSLTKGLWIKDRILYRY
jgi:hypothetical protein